MSSEFPPGDPLPPAVDYRRVRPWTLWLVLPFLIVAAIAIVLAIPKGQPAWRSVAGDVATFALLAGWSAIQIQRSHASLRDFIGRTALPPSAWSQVLLALPAASLAVSLSWLTHFLLRRWGLDLDLSRLNPLSRFGELGIPGRVMEVLLVVVLAPVIEESIFRGLLLRAWTLRLGLAKALLYTSLLFGVGHGNPVGITVGGLMLGILMVTSGSLLIPIGCHALNNGIAVLGSWKYGPGDAADWGDPKEWRVMVPLALVSAAILIAWYRAGARGRVRLASTQWPQAGSPA